LNLRCAALGVSGGLCISGVRAAGPRPPDRLFLGVVGPVGSWNTSSWERRHFAPLLAILGKTLYKLPSGWSATWNSTWMARYLVC